MADPNVSTESFHGSGIEGELRCYGEQDCVFDVELDGGLVNRTRPTAVLEVLYQPRQPGTGSPVGCPLRLLCDPLDLVYIGQVDRAVGRSWLPGLEPRLVRLCYFRVFPNPRRGA
jgi:hypothetical protein